MNNVEKLKKLGVYDRFCNNLQKANNTKHLNDTCSFRAYIVTAFTWKDTSEGSDFWQEVSSGKKPSYIDLKLF